jgi:hypothetical protein
MSDDSRFKLLSATLGLIGGSAAAAAIGYFSSSTVEREKFDYALVQQALEAESPVERQQRLKFIIDMGFISNKVWQKRLSDKLNETPEEIPQLPKTTPVPPPILQPQNSSFSQGLISDFFSKAYEIRSRSYGNIINNHSNNPSVLISLLASAPNYFDDGNAVVNTLTITNYFTDSAIVQAKPSAEEFLLKIDNLIAEKPSKWKKAKGLSTTLKDRINNLVIAK